MASHQVQVRLRPASRRTRVPRSLNATAAAGAFLCVAAGAAAAWAGYRWGDALPAAAALATGVAAVAAATVSSALAGHFSAAMWAITQAAKKAAGGDLEVRLLPGRRLGTQALAAAFNEMLASVAAERRELLARLAHLEAQLQELHAEGGARQRELKFLLLAASSQLRAPALGIRGFANLIGRSKGSRLDAAGREHLARICADAARMEHLVSDLSELTSLERGCEETEWVDSRQVLALVRDDLAGELSRTDIRIDLPGSLPRVAYPPRLLAVVFHRLLGRALRATGDRPGTRVAVGCERLAEGWRFRVRDDAPATTPRHHRGPAELAGDAESADASTVDMDILLARRIVELYGGRLWAEGAPRTGNTFFFTIPHRQGEGCPDDEGVSVKG